MSVSMREVMVTSLANQSLNSLQVWEDIQAWERDLLLSGSYAAGRVY